MPLRNESGNERIVWAVTGYDLGGNSGYVTEALFTTREAAEKYASESTYKDEVEVEEYTLYDEAPEPYTYWHRGAEVYPDKTVKDWCQEHSAQPPGEMSPVDDHLAPWDGHTQGHCGLHISIFGTDREALEAAFQGQVKDALDRSDGTCPGCGRTEDFWTDFWEKKPIQVRLAGGPKDGETREENALGRYGVHGSSVLHCHTLTWPPDDSDNEQVVYGSITQDEATGDWVRRHVR